MLDHTNLYYWSQLFDIIFNANCNVTETEKGIFDAILHGDVDLESEPWPSISESAKDLVRKMLTKDPKKRITAAEALGNYFRIYNALSMNQPRIFNLFSYSSGQSQHYASPT